MALRPTSSISMGQLFCALKSSFHIPSCITPRKCYRVRGSSRLNSHMGEVQRWQGRMQQKSIICTTLVRPTFLLSTLVMRTCSVCTSVWDPLLRPFAVQEMSLLEGLDLNSGITAHLVRRGSVI